MLLLTRPPRPKIVATILVRNEQDIIAANIEHHIEQGVSQFIVTDNLSHDSTREILAKYKEVVEIIEEKDDTHNQAASVTRMARLATKLKPDWILHLDADELWGGLDNLAFVKQPVVASTKSYIHPSRGRPFDVVDLAHFLNLDGIEEIPGRGRDTKIIHRPMPEVEILHGNHGVRGMPSYETDSIYRHHYPVRTFAQFQRKVVYGHEAMLKRVSSCDRWSKWYDIWKQNKLYEYYNEIVDSWEDILAYERILDNMNRLLNFWCEPDLANELFERVKKHPSKSLVGFWP
jgi:glycosyltransferase involved in cell wall biosynthesis